MMLKVRVGKAWAKPGVRLVPMVVVILGLGLSSAHAALFTWDGGGGTANANWTTALNWSGNVAPSASSSLAFGGITSLSPHNNEAANFQVNGITFSLGAGAFTLSGNAINLLGNVTNSSANLQTVNLAMALKGNEVFSGQLAVGGVISGAFGLTKSDASELTLNGADTYSGGTTLSAGTLNFGNVKALGSGPATFTGNATLQAGVAGTVANNIVIDASTAATLDTQGFAVTLSGSISGAGTLDKIGSGKLTLSKSNNFSGGTNLAAGTLDYTSTAALGSSQVAFTGNATLQSGVAGTLANNIVIDAGKTGSFDPQGYSPTLSGVISGSGVLDKVGTGMLTLSNASNSYGSTTISTGTLEAVNVGALGSGAVTDNGVLAFKLTSPSTYGGAIGGTGSLLVTGSAGPLTLPYANTYSGGTSLASAAVLTYGNLGAMGSGTVNFLGSATLKAGVPGTLANNVAITTGTVTFDTQGNAVTLGGNISGPGNLTMLGGGALTLAGNDTFGNTSSSGITTVSSGTLILTGSAVNAKVSINSGATFNPAPLSGTTGVSSLTLNTGSAFYMSSGSDTLHVGGKLTLTNAALTFGLGSNRDNDTIAVALAAVVSGHNTISIAANGNAPQYGQQYNLITAATGLGTNDLAFSYVGNQPIDTASVVINGIPYVMTLHASSTCEYLTSALEPSIPWCLATAGASLFP